MPRSIETSTGLKFFKTRAETGQVYKRWRTAKGLTKSAFAGHLGLSPNAYFYIESGKYYPNYQTIALSRQIGLDVSDLFDLKKGG